MKKGLLIVIEGVDGSGKETQSKSLYEYFAGKGKNIKKVTFPRYENSSSALVKMYLSGDFGSNPNDINPYAASTFYAVDRYAAFKEELFDFYNNGGIIIADRYTTSNMVHQGGKLKDIDEKIDYMDWLWDLEFLKYGLPIPDVVFYLDIPPEINIKLMAERKNKISNESKKDIHERSLTHLQDSYENALWLIRKYKWTTIQCMDGDRLRTIEDIHIEIVNKVSELLANIS
jgi:dTMP kinase